MQGADASLFDLIGLLLFTGGTGSFLGASGAASFTAQGQFVSAVEATVPEPGTAALGLLGLLGVLGVLATRRVKQRMLAPTGTPQCRA